MKTLTEALKDNGYTHTKSETVDGKQDIYKGDELVGTMSASQAWEFLREYNYRMSLSGVSGTCDVCGTYIPNIHYQVESRSYAGGETYADCNNYYGCESCLISKRR